MGDVLEFRPYKKPKRKQKKKRNTNRRGIHPVLFVLILIAIMSAYYLIQNGLGNIEQISYGSVYSMIEEGILDNKTEIVITTHDEPETIGEELVKVIKAHPEVFWLTGGATVSSMPNTAIPTYTLKLDSRCNKSDIPRMREQLNVVVDKMVEATEASCNSDYEKAEYVHDLIALNCSYDYETYRKSMIIQKGDSLAYSAYGCLVDGEAVCAGYAAAYKLVLNALDIECEVVSGTANNGDGVGNHGWNYIMLDDGYYFVDVTWDDPSYEGYPDSNTIRKDYFCLNTEMMSKDHFPDESEDVPYCDGRKYLNRI